MRRTLGGLAYLAGLLYLVAEAVVARAWTDPAYSRSENYISDLGLTQCVELDRGVVCSPLHTVFNGTFVLIGLLTALGSVALAPLVVRRWRPAVLAAALVHAAGVVAVGVFPGSVVEAIGGDARQMMLHSAGTLAAIGGGNLLVLLVAIATRRAHPRYTVVCALLVSVGLVGIALDTFAPMTVGPGAIQRMTVYPVVAWLVVTGVLVLVARPPVDGGPAGSPAHHGR